MSGYAPRLPGFLDMCTLLRGRDLAASVEMGQHRSNEELQQERELPAQVGESPDTSRSGGGSAGHTGTINGERASRLSSLRKHPRRGNDDLT